MHKIIQQVKTKPFPIRGEKTGLFNKLCWNMQLNMGKMEFANRLAPPPGAESRSSRLSLTPPSTSPLHW